MKNVTMNVEETRKASGGAKVYGCPWCNVKSTNYWKVYGHAIACGIPHGYYNLPISMILKAFGL